MKIFRLYSPNRDFRTIAYGETPLMSLLEDVNGCDYDYIQRFDYHWDCNDKPICDCPFLMGCIPVIRKAAITKIHTVFPENLVQSIDINVEGELFEIILAKEILTDALNESKSLINRFSDGRIMSIDKYVFKKRKTYPSIFKIGQLQTFTFITNQFYEVFSDANLTGIAMEECDIKSIWSF